MFAAIAIAALAISSGCSMQHFEQRHLSAEERLIDKYLREILPTGEYELINSKVSNSPWIDEATGYKSAKAMMWKYRHENSLGGKSVSETIFIVVGDKVLDAYESGSDSFRSSYGVLFEPESIPIIDAPETEPKVEAPEH